jgi:hypothetical protein
MYSKFAVLSIAFVLFGCATSGPYVEDRGSTQVVTEPPGEVEMEEEVRPPPAPALRPSKPKKRAKKGTTPERSQSQQKQTPDEPELNQ